MEPTSSLALHPNASSVPNPIGRDEMNLAEFPIALLSDRAVKGQKTLQFEDCHGTLTVTGSDAFGLPTAADTDVIVALIYLTKQRTNFHDAKVNFSTSEIVRLLNWPEDGKSFQRLKTSFSRWVGVSLFYDKCWWNNRLKIYTTAQMHIIESVEIISRETLRKACAKDRLNFEQSHFTWNRKFIESCQADNLRQLDLDTYFSLKSAITKRMYRFLGKRFYQQADWVFDLREIAFERVGLSRSYAHDAGKIKEKLQSALNELESIGFLSPLSREDRYQRVDRGRWSIRLTRNGPARVEAPTALVSVPRIPEVREEVESPLVVALVERGVTRSTAIELVRTTAAERIEAQLEHLAWFQAMKPTKITDPAAWLCTAIKADHAPPRGFVDSAERQRRIDVKAAQACERTQAQRQRRAEVARERATRAQVAVYRSTLEPAQLARLEAEAIARARSEVRQNLEDPALRLFRQVLITQVTNEYIAQLVKSN